MGTDRDILDPLVIGSGPAGIGTALALQVVPGLVHGVDGPIGPRCDYRRYQSGLDVACVHVAGGASVTPSRLALREQAEYVAVDALGAAVVWDRWRFQSRYCRPARGRALLMLALTMTALPGQPLIYAAIIIGMLVEFPHLTIIRALLIRSRRTSENQPCDSTAPRARSRPVAGWTDAQHNPDTVRRSVLINERILHGVAFWEEKGAAQ